jgi:hypothetical protein
MLLKIGIFVFLIGWVILSGWSLASLLPSQATPDSPTHADGSKVRPNPFLRARLNFLSAYNCHIVNTNTYQNTAPLRHSHLPPLRRCPPHGQCPWHSPPNPEPEPHDGISRYEAWTQLYTRIDCCVGVDWCGDYDEECAVVDEWGGWGEKGNEDWEWK